MLNVLYCCCYFPRVFSLHVPSVSHWLFVIIGFLVRIDNK